MYGDSALVINQLNKDRDTTHEKMDSYYKEIHKLEGKFYGIEYIHLVRDKNQATDAVKARIILSRSHLVGLTSKSNECTNQNLNLPKCSRVRQLSQYTQAL